MSRAEKKSNQKSRNRIERMIPIEKLGEELISVYQQK
jgi:hypothetical protein